MSKLGTQASQLERYLGRDVVEGLSDSMRNWYGPPIAVAGVPGKVYACAGGDFRGRIAAGQAASALCLAEDFLKRLPRRMQRWAIRQASTSNAGFASLGDLISEATTGGKKRDWSFNKVGTTGAVAKTSSLWRVGALPAAGAAAAAAPGGTVPTDATLGALSTLEAVSPDTRHFVSANLLSSVAAQTLLMYDRLFAVAKTMNSTATEAVTGAPTRYTNTVAGSADSAGGNFLFVETGTALAATAHNWTACLYTDQGGTTGQALPSLVGNSGNGINQIDHPLSQWFAPLATGDTGIKALTQMQCSALVATGAVDFVIGHPIAMMPIPIANMACIQDGINTAFNLTRIFDAACLAFLEVTKSATTAATYTGTLTAVHG